MSKACVVGLGDVARPMASMLASAGHVLSGFDIREDVVRMCRVLGLVWPVGHPRPEVIVLDPASGSADHVIAAIAARL